MKKLIFLAMTLLSAMAVKAAGTPVTIPDGVEAEDYTLDIVHALAQQDGNTTDVAKKRTVKVAFNGADVYLQGLAYWFPDAYVKGTLADGKVSIVSGQFLGEDMAGDEYLTGYVKNAEGGYDVANMLFDYDEATRTLTLNSSVTMAETSAMVDGVANTYCMVRSAVYTPGALPPLVGVEVPADLQAEPYLLIATQSINEENEQGDFELVTRRYEIPVNVGFSGDDLYIQGMVENVKSAWAKATKNASGQYVIPVAQYIGTQVIYSQEYNYFLGATSRYGGLSAITFNYDAATGTLSSTQTIAPVSTDNTDVAEAYYTLKNVSIKKIVEREATPSAPELTLRKQKSPYGGTMWYYADMFIALTDVDQQPMLADKVSFVFYKDKGGEVSTVTFPKAKFYMLDADVTEMAYDFQAMPDFSNHLVYFEKLGESELLSWTRLGLQTIYRGNGVEHRSEITWVDLAGTWTAGIQDVQAAGSVVKAEYDLQGRRTDGNARGLVIRRVQQADGTMKAIKVMKR